MADEPTTESPPLEHLEATLLAALALTREMAAEETETPPSAADDAGPRDVRES